MAKFSEVRSQIRDQVASGRYGSVGESFVTVRELAKRYQVSLTTAQKVVASLKQEKVLVDSNSRTRPARIGPGAIRNSTGPRRGKTPRRFGLIVTDVTNPFFGLLSRYIHRMAGEQGFQILVASSESDFQREEQIIEWFLEVGVEGLLICPGLDEACAGLYGRLIDRGVPISFVSRRAEGVEADFVVAHSFAGGVLVAGHLVSLDYKSFGYLGFGMRLRRDERFQGFRSALLEEGIELPTSRVAYGEGRDIVHGYHGMKRLVQSGSPPRALFAFNDLLAIGALRYCQEQAIAVPDEVAIAGFDNLPECRVTSPALTSVAYPVESIARLSVQNLIERIEGPSHRAPHHILLEPHLVVRASTDPGATSPRSRGNKEEGTHGNQEEEILEIV